MQEYLEGEHQLGKRQGLKRPSLAYLVLHIRACRYGLELLLSKVNKHRRKIPTFLFLSYRFMLAWFELVRVVHYGAGSEETF